MTRDAKAVRLHITPIMPCVGISSKNHTLHWGEGMQTLFGSVLKKKKKKKKKWLCEVETLLRWYCVISVSKDLCFYHFFHPYFVFVLSFH